MVAILEIIKLKTKIKMELQTILASSDPEAGKIIGFFVIGPLLALGFIIYKSRKDKSK
jgi:hypothetical protein